MRTGLLDVRDVRVDFLGVKAVDGVSIQITECTISALIGPNGAGKTTLFDLITGFVRPASGTIWLNGVRTDRMPSHRIATMGATRSFQELRLIRQATVLDNVMLAIPDQAGEGVGRALRGAGRVQERHNRDRSLEWLDFVGLANLQGNLASDLSYGQQKLLVLAACLATESRLLLLDEPFAGVSAPTIDQMMEHFNSIVGKHRSVFFIEHNLDVVRQIAHDVTVMSEGRVIANGSWAYVSTLSSVLEAYLV